MNLCEVVKVNDQWHVYAVNPLNPDDRRLINVCETEEYAYGLADDVNRLATECCEAESGKEEAPPKPTNLFDLEPRRIVRFED